MKLSLINESMNVVGKLDPLIVKYGKLKDSSTDDAEYHYKLILDKLSEIKTSDELKNFLTMMYNNLKDESKEVSAAKAKMKPGVFSANEYKSRLGSLNRSISTYNDISKFCKDSKLL